MKYKDPKTGEKWDAGWYGRDFIITREYRVWQQMTMPQAFAQAMFKAFSEPRDVAATQHQHGQGSGER